MQPNPHPQHEPDRDREETDRAVERLFPLVYEELRGVARRQLRRVGAGHTLSTTALVHEAYLKLAAGRDGEWADRAHFLGVAARAMRQVLVDYSRRYGTAKRGGAWSRVALDEACVAVEMQADTLLALDQALTRLAQLNERLARVVECRFFGGMSEDETAQVLAVTARTVRRDWVKARLWLYDSLHGGGVEAAPQPPRTVA